MQALRSLLFRLLLVAMIACTFLMKWQGGLDGGGEFWLIPLGMLGAVYAIAVVADVTFHAWKGEGQVCQTCGQIHPVNSFRLIPHPPRGPSRCG